MSPTAVNWLTRFWKMRTATNPVILARVFVVWASLMALCAAWQAKWWFTFRPETGAVPTDLWYLVGFWYYEALLLSLAALLSCRVAKLRPEQASPETKVFPVWIVWLAVAGPVYLIATQGSRALH